MPRWLGGSADGDRDSATRKAGSERPAAERTLTVSGILVVPRTIAETVATTGTLLAEEDIDLQAEVSGRIVEIGFSEGARVRAGELLVKLNDADLQVARLAAMRELELARRRERRAAELLAQSFVRQEDYDAALSAVQILESRIALTEAQIAKTEIHAPFDGVAGLRYVSEGAVVGTTTRIATLQRIDTMKIEFAIPEKYSMAIDLGSQIEFSIAGSSRVYEGDVYAIDPRIDPETRTMTVRARCENEHERLLPGAFANIRLTVSEHKDALLIPAAALIPDLDSAYVLVARDGRVERRRVSTGTRTETEIQISAGLGQGEIVITSGLMQLHPGGSVNVEIDEAGIEPALPGAAEMAVTGS